MDRGELLVDKLILHEKDNQCWIVNSRIILVDASDSWIIGGVILKLIFFQSQMIDQCHDNRRIKRIVIA